MKKLIILFIAFGGLAVNSVAQVTANAPTSATIVAPIAIVKSRDMNFGNVAVSASVGTVALAPTLAASRVAGGGVTLPATVGTVTSASFTVSGSGTYSYSIILPASLTIDDGSLHTMIVNAFTSTPSLTGALVSGSQTLYVGATLNVGASQTPGLYTNAGGFPVTVNYN